MNEASFASLNPTLLARKGGAKPAMRPQLGPIPNAAEPANLEDLGWNDMGDDAADKAEAQSADIVPLTPMIAADAADHNGLIEQDNDPAVAPAAKTAKPNRAAKRRSALDRGKRAAFTLRLDAERHLKLRLASTIKGNSAQQLVTEALDAFLAEIEDLDMLTAKLNRQ